MKKAEQQNTTYSTTAVANSLGSPMPPAVGLSAAVSRPWADPSSAERSNRYPVPTQEHRPS